jgi:hypothetical protein
MNNFPMFGMRPIPHNGGHDVFSPNRDFTHSSEILAVHSEIPRPEYSYEWNSDCLRSVEFSTKPKVVALGCSNTLGQGLPVDFRWTDILAKKIGQDVGNISYSGASIAKDISSFFGMIHTYNYLPEYVICNFANLQRLYFVDPENKFMRDYFLNNEQRVSKAELPFEYGKIIPYEWVYYHNLDHIKMLEAFCMTNNVKLIWSTWSNNMTAEQEDFLVNSFKCYVKDPTRNLFPQSFEYSVNANSIEELDGFYKMHNWDSIRCHEEEKNNHSDIFEYAYDYHKIAGAWGPGGHWPHPGYHRQIHWAEFYYNHLKENNYV